MLRQNNANIGQSIMNKRINNWSPSGTKCQVTVFVSSVDFFLDICVTKGTLPHFYKHLDLLYYRTRFSLSSLRMRKRAVLTSGTYFREQQVLVQFCPHFAPTRHWYHWFWANSILNATLRLFNSSIGFSLCFKHPNFVSAKCLTVCEFLASIP